MNELQNSRALSALLREHKFRRSESVFLFLARLGADSFSQDTIVPNCPDVSATGLQIAHSKLNTRMWLNVKKRAIGEPDLYCLLSRITDIVHDFA